MLFNVSRALKLLAGCGHKDEHTDCLAISVEFYWDIWLVIRVYFSTCGNWSL